MLEVGVSAVVFALIWKLPQIMEALPPVMKELSRGCLTALVCVAALRKRGQLYNRLLRLLETLGRK